ncbi:MAG: hypothetical protein PHC88_08640 [Terrimicrobiaceae bacterium]|nr:hypothetical protein [Terrimicrobiaceae bacterium]
MRDPTLRAQVAKLLVAKWVSVDLTGFIAFVDETEVDDDGEADSLWALLAPALAGALPTLSDDVASRPELNEVVRRLIEYSARKNPVQALAWAKQWLLDDALESALATIAGEMIKKSPEQALAVLEQIHTSVRRVDAISAIAAVYGTTHPGEATAWAKGLAIPAERPYAVNAVLAARAEIEPEAASKEFIDFREKMVAAYSVERAAEMARMGVSDIKEHKNGEPLTPEEAMDSETLPGRDDPQIGLLDDAAMAIARNWAAADPAKAIQWSESLPTGRMKDDVIQSALTGWASRQPDAAYAYYKKNYSSDAAPAQPIFEAWAQVEPAQAAEQASQLTDPALREKAVSGVVSGWLDGSTDQGALAAWVDKLPGKQERDNANSQIAEATSYDEPGTAWQRATAIQNQSTRREALKSAFASLVESDPGQARTLLAEAKNLTPDETNRLNKMLDAATPKSSN